MGAVKYILIAFIIHLSVANDQKCKSCSQQKDELPADELKQIRFKYLKNQILKKLNLTQPPKIHLPKPSLKTLRFLAEMTENEHQAPDEQPNIEIVILYPKEDNFTYLVNQSEPCQRFEFMIPESLKLDKFLSAEVWFHQENSSNSIRVYQMSADALLQGLNISNQKIDKNLVNWSRFNVGSFDFVQAKENNITFEVCGEDESDIETVVDDAGDDKPFLIIRSDATVTSRKKRSLTCTENNTFCCLDNFYLNFEEIGWDNWIIVPDGYDANFCRGRCVTDVSDTRFAHSDLLLRYISHNEVSADDKGLNLCCTPSLLNSVGLLYVGEDGIIHKKIMPDMKVEACSCA